MTTKANQTGDEIAFLILSTALFVAMIYSIYMQSVVLFCFMALAVFHFEIKPWRISIRRNLGEIAGEVLRKPQWWIISLSFFIVLLGGLYSDDTPYWLSRLRIKLPFLLMPVFFFMIPSISNRTYLHVHLAFLLVVTLSTLPLAFQMVTNYTEILEGLRHGRPIATPVSHIRYSLMIAMSIVSIFFLLRDRMYDPLPKFAMIILGLYLILFLHFLAVRSGIFSLYIVAIIFGFQNLLARRKTRSSLVLLLAIITVPVLSYQFIPSFQKRIAYMIEDATQYSQKDWNAYSDAERILSIKAGLDIAKENILVGTGSADLQNEMKQYFMQHYDKDTFIMPHNQFVSIMASAGILGLLLFLTSLILPLVYNDAYKNSYFLAINLIIFLSLMVENTFETSLGVALYCYFVFTGLNQMKGGHESKPKVSSARPVL